MSTKPTIEVTETNFETEVLKSNQPVLVGFATGWRLPSMTLDGVLEEIARESIDYLKVVRVKLDHSPQPGVVVRHSYFSDGEVRVGIFGTTSKEAILSQVRLVINSRCMPEPGFARFNKD